jgi:hypothetical protein
MLAYIKQFGFGRQFKILIANGAEATHELEQLAQRLGAEFIAPEEIHLETYEELLIHSYFKFDLQISYIASIKFKYLTYYSDGLRNGLYGLPTLDARLHKLIYFGFKLREESFESCVPQSLKEVESETVTFNTIENIWHEIHESTTGSVPFFFRETDLLLVMRYWGMPGPYYQFSEDLNILDYLKEEFSELPTFNRLIFRPHPLFDHKITKHDLQILLGDQIEVVMWEEVFQVDSSLSEISEPESIIYNNKQSPGLFFGFDSSLNILVAEKWSNTRIIWPDRYKYSKYFLLHRSSEVVHEQIRMMQEFLHYSSESEVVELDVAGYGISNIISSMSLNLGMNSHIDATSERDALTQERDALTQERDALTQERDALTQERDALINSTIWRATKFFRVIVSLIKHK